MQSKKLSEFQQGKVIALLSNIEWRILSLSFEEDGKGKHHSTISWMYKRNNYKINGKLKRKEGSGRQKSYSPQSSRQIKIKRLILSMKGSCNTATEVHQKLKGLKLKLNSPSIPIPTIRRIMKSFDLHGRSRIRIKKPLLTKNHQKLRLQFARKYRKWNYE